MIVTKTANSPDEVISILREFVMEEYDYGYCHDCPPPSLDEYREWVESEYGPKKIFQCLGQKGKDLEFAEYPSGIRVGGDKKMLKIYCV